MTDAGERTDVLIVGGGPVGMALALDLTYRGIDCMVVDAGDGQVRHPKVSTIGPRSMELFRRWGVADAVRGRAGPPTTLWTSPGSPGWAVTKCTGTAAVPPRAGRPSCTLPSPTRSVPHTG
nr:FAD-dependent monooxygenase [Streptomyces sp. I6]